MREAVAALVGTELGTTCRAAACPVDVGDGRIVNVTLGDDAWPAGRRRRDGPTMLETLTSRVRAGEPSPVGGIENLDVADEAMEMQLQEVAYRSTLAAMDRALQSSLAADFLR